MTTIIAADFLWSYRCNGKGCCCKSGWRIGLVPDDLARLEAQPADGPLAERIAALTATLRESPFRPLLADENARGRRPEIADLPKDDAGICVMLAVDDLCDIHRHAGEDMLPRACQAFPVLAGATPGGIGTGWEMLCPEVAHALADAPGPAQLTAAPDGRIRAFTPDPWLAAPTARPIIGDETIDATGEWRFRLDLAARLAEHADDPLRPLARALAELTGADPAAAAVGVIEMLRRRALSFGTDRDRLRRLVRLCRGFFQHHRWGGSWALDALTRALDSDDACLVRHPHQPDATGSLVLANAAIAHQALAPHDSPGLAADVARSILILGDALFFRALVGSPEDLREADRMATAVALAESLHRGADAGLGNFTADLLAVATSVAASDAATRAPIRHNLAHALAAAVTRSHQRRDRDIRAGAGGLGSWVGHWRHRLGLPTLPAFAAGPPEPLDEPIWPLAQADDAPLATLLFTLAIDPRAGALAAELPADPDWPTSARRLAAQGLLADLGTRDPLELAHALDRRLIETWLATPDLLIALATT
jgi:hypothetical protein